MRRIWLCGVLLAFGASFAMAQSINAAGATFPAVIYQKWFEEYHKLHTSAQINYQSIGSGGGIAQLTAGTVDFGASDMPMTDDQLSKLKVPALHFPTVLGGVVPTYNIPGVSADPEVHAGNAGRHLPGRPSRNGTIPSWRRTIPGVKLPERTTSWWCTVRTAAARPSCGPIISPRSAPNGRARWAPTLP